MEANSVQPAPEADGGDVEGQGAESQISDPSIFPNLDQVPADYRQYIDPILKDVESNFNKKLEEHAGYRKQWEPYEELGVNELDPESLKSLMELGQIISDEDQFREWWNTVGDELGFAGEFEDDDDEFEDDETGYEDEGESLTPESIQEIVSQQLNQALQPIYQERQEKQYEQGIEEIGQQLDKQMSDLKDEFEAEHGQELNPEIEQHVWKTALAYEDEGPEAVKKAWDEVMGIVGDAKSELFAQKEGQPSRPEGPGTPNTSPEPITSFEDAKAAAIDRLESGQI